MRSSIRSLAARSLGVLVLAAGLLLTESCASRQTAAADELLVGFLGGTSSAQAEAVYAPLGATKLEELGNIGVHRIRVAPGSIESVERALKQSPAVRFVERNRAVRAN